VARSSSLAAGLIQMLAATPDERRAAAEATHQDADAITAGTTQEGNGQQPVPATLTTHRRARVLDAVAVLTARLLPAS